MHECGFVMNQSGGTAFQEYGDRRADYRFTNSRLRGEQNPNSDSSFTILTLGDSYTFGLLLNEEYTYTHHLQQWVDTSSTRKIKFLNAAVGGSGMADWPAWLETYGLDIQPDMVFYFMNNNDVFRALSKNLFVWKDSTLIESQRWKPTPITTKLAHLNWYRHLQEHSELMNLIVKALWKFVYFEDLTHQFNPIKTSVPIPDSSAFNLESNYSIDLSMALINRMENWCSSNNCSFVLTNTGYFQDSMLDEYTMATHQFLKDSDYPYLDLYPCVNEAIDGNFTTIQIPVDLHPNELGARTIANCLIPRLPDFLPLR